MFNIGPLELMVILVIALLVVGPKRLPEVGRSIGRGLREFRRAQDEVTRTIRMGIDQDESAPTPGAPPSPGGDGSGSTEAGGTQTPTPAEGGSGSDATTDAVRTLGRSLAELRRAREELQRSFRVDLTSPPPAPRSPRPTSAPASPPQPTAEPRPSGEPPAERD